MSLRDRLRALLTTTRLDAETDAGEMVPVSARPFAYYSQAELRTLLASLASRGARLSAALAGDNVPNGSIRATGSIHDLMELEQEEAAILHELRFRGLEAPVPGVPKTAANRESAPSR